MDKEWKSNGNGQSLQLNGKGYYMYSSTCVGVGNLRIIVLGSITMGDRTFDMYV